MKLHLEIPSGIKEHLKKEFVGVKSFVGGTLLENSGRADVPILKFVVITIKSHV